MADAGLNAAVHMILGLPGEDSEDWSVSADRIAALPVKAVKLHNLHVVRDSPLEREFRRRPFPLPDEHRYADGVIAFLRRLPPDVAIMRLTTDTPEESLVAPRWSMTKGEFSGFLEQRMTFQGVVQGDLNCGGSTGFQSVGAFRPLSTDDGSVTFWSDDFKEHFHSRVGAATEARVKFVEASSLDERLAERDLRLLDVCFGLGYNALSACEAAETRKAGFLEVVAIEIDIRVVRAAAAQMESRADTPVDWRKALGDLDAARQWTGDYSSVRLVHGDARDVLDDAAAGGLFDVVFLDAFSTQRNAELWSVDFFRRLRGVMSEGGILVTYCAALPVRAGLLQAGFHVGETTPVGRKRGGTIAALRKEDIGNVLSEGEMDLIENTKRGIPYRDPQQVWTNRRILKERECERRMKGG